MTQEASPSSSRRLTLRLTATSAALTALAFVQAAGALAADTKLDLVLDPAGMLRRSLSMWDAIGGFGQVGNQAYGYLWPMGPFFLGGHQLGMPGWVIQRLWLATVLVVAFLGCARLLRALGIRHDLAIILGGVAYALSPRMLSTTGPISIEAWPSALAPWVLLALVLGSRQGSPRRYAWAAGLGVAMVGGVNAAATFAVIPLGVVWLLTRSRGPRRRSLMLWWPVSTVVGCVWWLLPLFVLGAYSPPFLDYIETAPLTTYPTTLFDTLRGTSAWIPYLEPRWRAGADLITTPLLIQHSSVVLLLGFVGLSRRDNPHRVFAAASLLVGVLMVTFGHVGDFPGWFAREQQTWLDGLLSPMRNVHKFDPIVRVPLVLGLAHLVDVVLTAWRARTARASDDTGAEHMRLGLLGHARHLAVVGLAVIAVAGSAQPAWTARLAPSGSFAQVPGYWSEAATWLARRDPDARTLLLPGSDFGSYVWGTPQDEPIQSLAKAPWGVRNAIPLAPVGNIRALDALEQRLGEGRGSPGLADYLRRIGVRFLLVRNDLARSDDVVDTALVHQALAETPGVDLVESFGPIVGGEPKITRKGVEVSINQGWQDSYAAIEVFEISRADVPAVSTSEVPRVVGDPESLLDLSESGVIDDRPTVLALDASGAEGGQGPVILTDGMRLRDRYFANMHDGTSATLTSGEASAMEDRRDYELTSDPALYTRAAYEGIDDLVASSSTAEASTPGGARPGTLPFAAIDGDLATQWVSRPDDGHAPFLRVEMGKEVTSRSVRLTLGDDPAALSDVRLRTEAGVGEPVVMSAGDTATISVPPGPTSWIQVEDAEGREDRQLSIAELEIPGVAPSRWLEMPDVPREWGAPDVIAMSAHADLRTGCVQLDQSIRCRPQVLDEGEEAAGMRRTMNLSSGGMFAPTLMVAPRPGEAVPGLLQEGNVVSVASSSRASVGASVSSAVAALDANPGTTWISSWTDAAPTLDISWLTRRTVRSIDLSLDPTVAALRPEKVTITYPGGSQSLTLDEDGHARVAPFRSRSMSILITRTSEGGNLDSDGTGSPLGVGVSEVAIQGVPFARVPVGTEDVDYGCGSGPDLTINDRTARTAIVAAPLDLHLGRAVPARVCGAQELRLTAGINRIEYGANEAVRPVSVVLERVGAAQVAGEARTVRIDGASYATSGHGGTLATRHNENPGWEATADGRDATPVVLDGWQQGFLVPAGTQSVEVRFGPDRTYRVGLAAGALLLIMSTLAFALTRRRRVAASRPVGTSVAAGRITAACLVAGGGLVAGWPGFAVVAVASVTLRLLSTRSPDLAVAIGVAPIALVGIWNSAHPWGGAEPWGGSYGLGQLLMLLPLALLASVVSDTPARNPDSGTSTRR